MGRGGQWWERMLCFWCLSGGLGSGLWFWWSVGLWPELRLRLRLRLQVWLWGRELLWGWVWVTGRLCVLVSMGGHAWRGRGLLLLLSQHARLYRGPGSPCLYNRG